MTIEAIADRANDLELSRAQQVWARSDYDPKAAEIAACRSVVAAIKAIPVWALTPNSVAHICAVLSAAVQHSGWGHQDIGEHIQTALTELSDELK